MQPACGAGLTRCSSPLAGLSDKGPVELLGKVSPKWLGIPQVDVPER